MQQFALHGEGVGCGVCGGGFAAPTNPTFPLFAGAPLSQNDWLRKPAVSRIDFGAICVIIL